MSLLKLCVVVCHPVYVFVHQSKYELCPCQCRLFAANAHVHLGYHNFKVKCSRARPRCSQMRR